MNYDDILWDGKMHIGVLVQERCNYIASALELRLYCTYPSICSLQYFIVKLCISVFMFLLSFLVGQAMALMSACVYVTAILLLTFGAETLIMRRKQCVTYEVEDIDGRGPIIATLEGQSHSRCVMQCAHNKECGAVNIEVESGLCILLPPQGHPICQMYTFTLGFTLVALGSCDDKPPLLTFGGNNSLWVSAANADLSHCVSVLSDGSLYVTRIMYKGMYVIGGWSLSSGSVFASPDKEGRFMVCKRLDSGQLLTLPSGVGHTWASFVPGSPVPQNALVGGSWGSTPIYIIRNTEGGGYYNPDMEQAFVMGNTEIEIMMIG